MKPPFSSWKYETGFLTAVRGGDAYELGYFTSRVEARKVALSFLDTPGGDDASTLPGWPKGGSR